MDFILGTLFILTAYKGNLLKLSPKPFLNQC